MMPLGSLLIVSSNHPGSLVVVRGAGTYFKAECHGVCVCVRLGHYIAGIFLCIS